MGRKILTSICHDLGEVSMTLHSPIFDLLPKDERVGGPYNGL